MAHRKIRKRVTSAFRILVGRAAEVLCAGDKSGSMQFTLANGSTELLKADYSSATHSFVVDGKEVGVLFRSVRDGLVLGVLWMLFIVG